MILDQYTHSGRVSGRLGAACLLEEYAMGRAEDRSQELHHDVVLANDLLIVATPVGHLRFAR